MFVIVHRLLLALVIAASSGAVSAATTLAAFTPASPDANDLITAYISASALCANEITTLIDGHVVRSTILFYDCVGGPSGGDALYEVNLGSLPAGTYTYELYAGERGGPPPIRVYTETLVVVAAPANAAAIPTLDRWHLVALSALIALVACGAMRRLT